MFVRPSRLGLIVRDPFTGEPIPAAGKEVGDNDAYFLRRIKDGDLIRVEHKAADKPGQKVQPNEGKGKEAK